VADELDLLPTQRSVFRSGLRSAEKLVALALLDHWSAAGEVFPSVNRLAAWTSLDRTTVMRALDALKARGAIVVIQGERGKANRYELRQLSLLAPDQSHHATSRTTRPVAPRDLNRSHHATGVVAPSDPKDPIQGSQEGTHVGPRAQSSTRRSVAKWRRVPESWNPSEAHRELAKQLGVSIEAEEPKFRDHEFAKPKSDADAAFRTWLRNALSFGARGASGGRNGAFVPQRGRVERERDTSWLDDAGANE
jgi:hypothetical protein